MHAYLATLSYLDCPDYDYLQSLIHSLFLMSGKPEDVPYDWELARHQQANLLEDDLVPGAMDLHADIPIHHPPAPQQNPMSDSMEAPGLALPYSHDPRP
ncbi:hypothetical protein HK101_006076, partial [Irineochytrium annulatum]